MMKRVAPFLLGAMLVALSGTNAAADRPIREIVDPMFLIGDPWEPDRAQVKPSAAVPQDLKRTLPTAPPSNQLVQSPRRAKLVQLLGVFWRMQWLMR